MYIINHSDFDVVTEWQFYIKITPEPWVRDEEAEGPKSIRLTSIERC